MVTQWQLRRLESRKSPPHMKYAKRGGVGVERAHGQGQCAECGGRICFDTNHCGGLVALELNAHGGGPHKHQPPAPNRAENRRLVARGLYVEGYVS
jgi:hypothetical protein